VPVELLRQQNLLRDFVKEHSSSSSAICEEQRRDGIKRDMLSDALHDRAELPFVRSTIFSCARSIVRNRCAAARCPLHISHLIHGR
jgi:hypothetical protein